MTQFAHIGLIAILGAALPLSLASADLQNRPLGVMLSSPGDFRFAFSDEGELGKSGAAGGHGELAMQWSPVIGARTYAVQFCGARQCSVYTQKNRHGFASVGLFRDVAIVSSTKYLAWGLKSGREYWFRVAGIDGQGARGDYSSILIRSAP